MSFGYKILGQSNPAINTTDNIYTVPNGKQAIISTITVCNQDLSQASTYSIIVVPNGVVAANKHYVYKEKLIDPRDTALIKIGVGLAEGDIVKVFTSTGNVSFSVFGTEYLPPAA